MDSSLEIVRINADHAKILFEFFQVLRANGDDQTFHPHGFGSENVVQLCTYVGKDMYYIAKTPKEVLGYGMLRGWDAGYHIPSLGICTTPQARGKGIGRMLMTFLHAAAKLRGATSIRLKVYPNNAHAVRLYEALNYDFIEMESEQRVYMVKLGAAKQ
jgi:ribosomal protein S18 acetylase RimI-like enzyme